MLCLISLFSLLWIAAAEVPTSPLARAHAARATINRAAFIGVTALLLPSHKARAANVGSTDLHLPMEWYDNVLCARFRINGTQVRAIVDTGSPFLVVPTVCTREWGCLTTSTVSGIIENSTPQLEDTIEIFGGQEYDTKWRDIDVTLNGKFNNVLTKKLLVAVVGSDVLLPPGGVFFGLVKYKSTNIRPTFLSQTNFKSIKFDAPAKMLTLSERNLVQPSPTTRVIKLEDLRPKGDSVFHYAAKIKRLVINGRLICGFKEERDQLGWPDEDTIVKLEKQDVYAVFDTGTTGCIIQDEIFFDQRFPQPPRSVEVVFETTDGDLLTVKAGATRENLFVVSPSKIPWFQPETRLKYSSEGRTDVVYNYDKEGDKMGDNPQPRAIVLGLAFLRDQVMTIDTDRSLLSLEYTPPPSKQPSA
jgi:hypothetical protein